MKASKKFAGEVRGAEKTSLTKVYDTNDEQVTAESAESSSSLPEGTA